MLGYINIQHSLMFDL